MLKTGLIFNLQEHLSQINMFMLFSKVLDSDWSVATFLSLIFSYKAICIINSNRIYCNRSIRVFQANTSFMSRIVFQADTFFVSLVLQQGLALSFHILSLVTSCISVVLKMKQPVRCPSVCTFSA